MCQELAGRRPASQELAVADLSVGAAPSWAFAATGIQRSVWREGARPMGSAPGLDPRKGCGRPLLGRQVVAHGSSGSRTRQKHRPCGTGWRRQDLAGRGHALRFRQDAAHGHDARRQVVPRLRSRGNQAQVHHFHLHRPHPLQGLQDQRAGHLRPPRLHRRHAGHHAGGRNGPVRGGRRRWSPRS